MSNFYTHHSYDVYYNTWYIDRTGDIHIDDVPNYDIIYEVLHSSSDDEIDIINPIFDVYPIPTDHQNCPICMETNQPTHICKLNCKHSFCHHCIIQYMERKQQYSTCPLCRHVITSLHIHT